MTVACRGKVVDIGHGCDHCAERRIWVEFPGLEGVAFLVRTGAAGADSGIQKGDAVLVDMPRHVDINPWSVRKVLP